MRLANAVAVVADNTWTAMKALAALAIDWDPGAGAGLDTAELERCIEVTIDGPALPHINEGDVDKAEAERGRCVTNDVGRLDCYRGGAT